MANAVIVSNSVEPQIETTETVDGKVYTHKSIEKNVGSGGGSYSQAFTDAKCVKYVGDVTVGSSSTAIASASSGWTVSGTAPTNASAFYVKFDSKVGTTGQVWVHSSTLVHAKLEVGESVTIPYFAGAQGVANLKIKTTNAYSAGTTVATVTAIVIGD